MTLQQLRYVLAVAKTKSFSQAAELLFISQPALSKQIALLEKRLQFPLFERTSKGIMLTEKGSEFCERLHPIISELDLVLSEFTEPTEIRVGCLPSISSYYLPTIAGNFDIKLKAVVAGTSMELLEMAAKGELDAALVQDVPEFKGLKGQLLFSEPYLIAVSKQHSLSLKSNLLPEDIKDEPLVMYQAPCDMRDYLLDTISQLGLAPRIEVEAALNEAILGYTASGVGISFIPNMVAETIVHKGIRFKEMKNAPLKRNIFLYARSQTLLDHFHKASGSKRPEDEIASLQMNAGSYFS